MKHYIGMSGDHGYLPDFCDVFDTKAQAVDSLAFVFDNIRGVKSGLRRDNYFEFPDYRVAGAEYAEIAECVCDKPWVHSDSTTEREYKRDHNLV